MFLFLLTFPFLKHFKSGGSRKKANRGITDNANGSSDDHQPGGALFGQRLLLPNAF